MTAYARSLQFLADHSYGKTITPISKFGANTDVDLAAVEDVWTVGGTRTWLSAAVPITAVSASTADNAGQAGALVITIQGLDSNWDEAEADLTMAGASQSAATTASFFRINRAFVKEMGTYHGSNTGAITIQSTTGGVHGQIAAASGQTEQSHYSLATGKTLHLASCYVSGDVTLVITPVLWQATGIDDVSTPFVGAKRKLFGISGLKGHVSHQFDAWPTISGPADVWWSVDAASNNTSVEAGFDGFLTVN